MIQKKCSKCKEVFEIFLFYPCSHSKDGYKGQCKECVKKAVKASAQKHAERVLERNRRYRAKNPEKIKEWKKRDRKTNSVRIHADNSKRRAKLKTKLTKEIIQIYALRDFFIEMSLGEKFHIDHIVPLSKGGAHELENLRVIPAIDNLRKADKILTNKLK